ncbi:MAG: hypothetical protein KUL86_02970 [Castellaniella sp.]|nr:hypothetical protein [Castellaniella sp.]
MTTVFLIWILIGIVIGLVYIPYRIPVDDLVMGSMCGLPLCFLLTFFVWPVTLVRVMQPSDQRSAPGRPGRTPG